MGKKIFKIFGFVVLGIIVLIVLAAIALNTPKVQNYLTGKALTFLEKNVNAHFSLTDIRIKFFNSIEITDFAVTCSDYSEQVKEFKIANNQNDTLLRLEKVTVSFSLKSLLDEKITLSKVKVSGGVFNLWQEEPKVSNIDRVFGDLPPGKGGGGKFDIIMKEAEIENFRFVLSNPFKTNEVLSDDMIDFQDLCLSAINAKAKDFNYLSNGHDTVTANLLYLNGIDKSGFTLDRLTGQIKVTSKQARIDNVYLSDGMSVVNADYYSMSYSNAKTLKYFLDSVSIGCKFYNSVLDFRTLGKMAPSLYNSTLRLNIEGEVIGPVSYLTSERMSAASQSGQTIATLSNVSLTGLPKPARSYLTATVENAVTNGKDLAQLLSELTAAPKIKFLDDMPPINTYQFKGSIGGTLLNLTTSGTLYNRNGNIKFASRVNIENRNEGVKVYANYALDDFDAGSFTGSSSLGNINADGNVYINSRGKYLNAEIDSLHISSAELLGKTFTNASVKGKYTDGILAGNVHCKDTLISFDFDGIIPIANAELKTYSGTLDLKSANLKELGLDKSGRESVLSLKAAANIDQTPDDILGQIVIRDASAQINGVSYPLGNAIIKSEIDSTDYYYTASLDSDFLQAKFKGEKNITAFIDKIKQLLVEENFSNLLKEDYKYTEQAPDGNYSLELKTLNTQGLCALLYDGLYVQNGTDFRVDINDQNLYNIYFKSGRVALKDNYLKNFRVSANNSGKRLNVRLFSKDVNVAGFKVDSTRMALRGTNNNFDLRLRFHNDTTGDNITNLTANVDFKPKSIEVKLDDSDITLKGEKWLIKPASIKIGDSLIHVNGLNIVNGFQSFKASGTLSQTKKDSLGVSMENFNLAIVDLFLSKPLGIQGLMSGRGVVSMNKGNSRMYAGFRGDSLSVHGSYLGTAQILARWNVQNKNYDLLLRTKNGDNVTCDIRGHYKPENNYLDINSTLNDFSMTYFEPLLSSVITNTSGTIKGKIRLFGSIDDLTLTGNGCSFENFKFTLEYTKVPYTLNGPIEITENGITLKNNVITDDYNGRAIASGGVTYKNFKNLKLNTRLRLENMQVLATKEGNNSDFYGDAFATGTVNITGNQELLKLDISAQTEPKTFIHIPISKSSNASTTNLLTFVEREKPVEIDPYDTLYNHTGKKNYSPLKVGVNLNITANENADIWLEIDKNNGDIIKAKGNGNVKIGVDAANNDFSLNGNYIISNGSYHFVLMNITSRDFIIEDGSSVTMNGSPNDIDLDITGVFKTKAAVNYLIADTSGVNTTRMVQAYIYIKGKLSEPQISFNIEIPDLDPTTKAKVQTALNSDEKVQKQIAALLISGGFLPDVENGISQSGSNLLASNVSAIISNQVGKILTQLGIPVDLGINYVPGDKYASDAFEVALSTQLFDNRVIVNGNIGNDPYAEYNGRDVIGNIDVDIKLDQKGQIRLNLFSHSTDRYSNDLEESQKNGVGVSYQREFNSFKDIFRRRSPKQKEYDKMRKAREKEQRAKLKEEKKAAKKKEKEMRKKERAQEKAQAKSK